MAGKRWDSESDGFFKENYSTMSNAELSTILGRSVPSLIGRAQRLGLTKTLVIQRASDCSPLLDDSLEAMYWTGFILADGTISKRYRLGVSVSRKDESHLEKLATFLSSNVTRYTTKTGHDVSELKVQDSSLIKKYAEKFSIASNKTYNPPNLSGYSLSDDQFIAIIIGFIDGDGSRRTITRPSGKVNYSITIKSHQSWLPNLITMSDRLKSIIGSSSKMQPHILNSGYAVWTISDSSILDTLKEFVISNELPVLSRKWLNVLC